MNYSLTPKHQHGLKILSTWLHELYDKDISVIRDNTMDIQISIDADLLKLLRSIIDSSEYTPDDGRILNEIRWFYRNRTDRSIQYRTELQCLGID